MAQRTFNGLTSASAANLDLNFTELYDLRESVATAAYAGTNPTLSLSAGNLGVGATPHAWWSGRKVLEINSGTGECALGCSPGTLNYAFFGSNFYLDSVPTARYIGTDAATIYEQTGGQHLFSNAPVGTAGTATAFTRVMTIDQSGNVLVGTSTASVGSGGVWAAPGAGASSIAIGHASGVANGTAFENFVYAGSVIGSISQSTTTAVVYTTSSDYRLKTNVLPVAASASGAFIDALNPVTFTWLTDGSAGTGFIAHELQAVSPSSVVGAKDATQPVGTLMDAGGGTVATGIPQPAQLPDGQTWTQTGTQPVYQHVEYGGAEVIAMLVAEVKSLRARLAAARL